MQSQRYLFLSAKALIQGLASGKYKDEQLANALFYVPEHVELLLPYDPETKRNPVRKHVAQKERALRVHELIRSALNRAYRECGDRPRLVWREKKVEPPREQYERLAVLLASQGFGGFLEKLPRNVLAYVPSIVDDAVVAAKIPVTVVY